MFFKVKENLYTSRERIELADGDFLDVDSLVNGNKQCMLLTHGLEGDSGRYYIKRTARYFSERGWDIAAWNCRSCSGEMNRLPRFYHHGDTPDLHEVILRLLDRGYEQLVLVGYSMGGSMSLKYLGEAIRDPKIRGAVVFSVPCNLKDSSVQLTRKENRMYEQRFVRKLIDKLKAKSQLGSPIDLSQIDSIKDFDTFHEMYTAPLHGFSDREDFFTQATCDQFLPNINVPTLIVNALNDPMLGDLCYPYDKARESEFVFLETPKRGGHVGFTIKPNAPSYIELRIESFINEHILPSLQRVQSQGKQS